MKDKYASGNTGIYPGFAVELATAETADGGGWRNWLELEAGLLVTGSETLVDQVGFNVGRLRRCWLLAQLLLTVTVLFVSAALGAPVGLSPGVWRGRLVG